MVYYIIKQKGVIEMYIAYDTETRRIIDEDDKFSLISKYAGFHQVRICRKIECKIEKNFIRV